MSLSLYAYNVRSVLFTYTTEEDVIDIISPEQPKRRDTISCDKRKRVNVKMTTRKYAPEKILFLRYMEDSIRCNNNTRYIFIFLKIEYKDDVDEGIRRAIPCPSYTQIFSNRASYQQHFNSCIKGVYFNRKSTCDEHINSYLDEQYFHCKLCRTKYQTIGSIRNHAREKHMTTLAKLEQNMYVEPRENFLVKTKERYEKHMKNYILHGGNTTSTRHMTSNAVGCSATSNNAGNIHTIKVEAGAESESCPIKVEIGEESDPIKQVPTSKDDEDNLKMLL